MRKKKYKTISQCELVNSTDATVWAKEFCHIVGQKIPEIKDEEDWIMGWFANAIMAGWDQAARKYNQPKMLKLVQK